MMKKRYSFGVFDALACIMMMLLCVLLYLLGTPKNEGETAELFYTINVYEVRREVGDAIKAGDEIYDENGASIGTVQQIKLAQPYGREDEYTDMEIKVLALSSVTEKAYSVNGVEIRVGAEYGFYTSTFTGKGKCTSLQSGGVGGNNG